MGAETWGGEQEGGEGGRVTKQPKIDAGYGDESPSFIPHRARVWRGLLRLLHRNPTPLRIRTRQKYVAHARNFSLSSFMVLVSCGEFCASLKRSWFSCDFLSEIGFTPCRFRFFSCVNAFLEVFVLLFGVNSISLRESLLVVELAGTCFG